MTPVSLVIACFAICASAGREMAAASNSAASRAPIQGSFARPVAKGVLALRENLTFASSRSGASSSRDCTVNANR